MFAQFATAARRNRAVGALDPLTVRRAGTDDERAVNELAQLDSQRALAGDVLIAELAGRAVAALDLASGRVAADPFLRTADAVNVLRMRGAQLRGEGVRAARARAGGHRRSLRGVAVSR